MPVATSCRLPGTSALLLAREPPSLAAWPGVGLDLGLGSFFFLLISAVFFLNILISAVHGWLLCYLD
jgi:hypothetical protein